MCIEGGVNRGGVKRELLLKLLITDADTDTDTGTNTSLALYLGNCIANLLAKLLIAPGSKFRMRYVN